MLSPAQKRRYGRQIRLVEIGEAGQERLCDARARLSGGDPIEARYIEAAGMQIDASGADSASIEINIDINALGLRHDIPRSIADGAMRALIAFSKRTIEGQ